MRNLYIDRVTDDVYEYDDAQVSRGEVRAGLVRMTEAETAEHLSVSSGSAVPQSVTMRQARQAMLSAGILGQVDALIGAMPGEEGESARIDWNHARDVKRDWPLIGSLGPQIGLTEQQIDDLFVYAGSIPQ